MEEGRIRKEVEFDEFEKLLCEIPNATSGSEEQIQNKRVQIEESDHLPNAQCLTSAFSQLSYNDAPLSNYKSLGILMDAQLRKTNPNMDARVVVAPYATKVGHESSIVSKHLPLAHGMQYLSSVPVAGVEFPLMSDQQYYVHPQPQISMHQHYLWLQHLLRLDRHNPLQPNGNVPTRLRQPHFAVPLSQQHDQSNQELLWNNLSQSNLDLSSRNFNAPDKVGRHSFPEKMLTRSHGMNTLKTVKFSPVERNESLGNINQNAKLLSSGHFRHSLASSNDIRSPWASSPDTPTLKSIDLRSPSQRYNSVDEVTGRILLLAKDQHGCRFLQRKFSEGSPKDIEKIFSEIIDHIVELMTDPFGNYLVQKLLEVCNEDQQMKILHAVTRKCGDLVRISCDIHGTRAVQKVIETLKTQEQVSMVVSSLRPDIVPLMKNPNGNHVAQRCLLYLMPEYSEFLFEAASANCVELATDRHGCCVLQKCLSHSGGAHRRHLICEINANALILSQDPYGNYVVQFVLELQLPWATVDILEQLEGNYGDLSVQKYSSNVVEKCLKFSGEEGRARIIRELINNPRLDHIMQDPYGNYVIQAALNQSKGALQAALVDAIRPLVPVLRTSPYGKKVLSSNTLKK